MTLDLSAFDRTEGMPIMPTENVTVPRALLSLCADLLAECDKHQPITGTNFDDDMDLARKQLAAHLDAPATPVVGEDAWQLIETAPNDGSYIDVWFEGERRADVYWGFPSHSCGEAGPHCDNHPDREDWCDCYGYLSEDGKSTPTHWRHIPTKPNASHPSTPTQREQALEEAAKILDAEAAEYDRRRIEFNSQSKEMQKAREEIGWQIHAQLQATQNGAALIRALSPAPSAPESAAGELAERLAKASPLHWHTTFGANREEKIGIVISTDVRDEIVAALRATPPRLTIDEERVERAAVAIFKAQNYKRSWEMAYEVDKKLCRGYARAALTAALPELEGN